MHPSTLTPIASLLLAQANTGSSVGGNFPSVPYILAMVLVAAGLGLIVFVGLAWLRGRDQQDSLSPTEEQLIASYSAPAYSPVPASTNEDSTISLNSAAQAPVGTTQEAERLLRLMGEAEELCTRLARDLDERADRLERLMARANGMIGDTLSEGRMPQPSFTPARQPAAPQPQQRPEIITRPIGVPAMAAQQPQPHMMQPQMMGQPQMAQPQMYAPAPAAPAPTHAHVPAPAPRMPAPPPIPQPSYSQPMPPQQHQPQYTNGSAAQNNGQAYPAEAEALAQHIFRLADAGLTPAEIAQRLGQHTGKVELIIALRNA